MIPRQVRASPPTPWACGTPGRPSGCNPRARRGTAAASQVARPVHSRAGQRLDARIALLRCCTAVRELETAARRLPSPGLPPARRRHRREAAAVAFLATAVRLPATPQRVGRDSAVRPAASRTRRHSTRDITAGRRACTRPSRPGRRQLPVSSLEPRPSDASLSRLQGRIHRPGELPVERAGDIALEAAAGSRVGSPLGGAPGDVGAGPRHRRDSGREADQALWRRACPARRRMRDSNSRGVAPNTLSKRAP